MVPLSPCKWSWDGEVEATGGVVRIVAAAIEVAAVAGFGSEAVDGEVQAAEAVGFAGFLDAVDGEFRGRVMHRDMDDVASVEAQPADGAG